MEIAEDGAIPSWTYTSVKERIGRADTLLLVAADEHGITGFAAFREVGDDGELLQIAVDNERRRSGTGSALMDAVLGYAQKKSLARVFLEVRAGNAAAAGLYRKYGFEKVRIRKAYYDNPTEDAVIMALKIHT